MGVAVDSTSDGRESGVNPYQCAMKERACRR